MEDGKDHINIYSKGETELGRWLTNFAYAPVILPEGKFNTIEGYWYWLSYRDDRFKNLNGFKCKELGKKLAKYKKKIQVDNFNQKIIDAIQIKLHTYPKWATKLTTSTLPLKHYYNYGGKVVDLPQYDWIVDIFREWRIKSRVAYIL